MSVNVSCPGCGAAVEFKIGSSMVTVCPYCRSVVARGDRRVEDLGKVAALADTDSLLEVGLQGKYQGKPFTVTGRTQLRHAAGGIWDEWYASFANDQWGWIAEAQGRLYLTFPQRVAPGQLPAYESLAIGQSLHLFKGTYFTVAEKGEARIISGEGEVPYRLTPGEKTRSADLSGPGGLFATLDYSDDQPAMFLGREATLEELDLPERVKPVYLEERRIAGHGLNCPNCGGALELRAPDKCERVTCPNCNSLLDVSQGELRYLNALAPPQVDPLIPIGSLGKLAEGDMMAIGLVERCVTYAGRDYFWTEYLLYQAEVGFRWLVNSEGHWNYVKPVAPGDVSGAGRKAYYHGEKFQLFQRADAVVTYVMGEFYWKVQVGDLVQTSDFIKPPEMLSREISAFQPPPSEDGSWQITTEAAHTEGEVNWSHGTYMPPADVAKAFGLRNLPRGRGVAPTQPFRHAGVYLTWGLMLALIGLLGILFITIAPQRKVFSESYALAWPPTGGDKVEVIESKEFTLESRQNIQISAEASLDNVWLGVHGDIINQDTGISEAFFVDIEHFSGTEDGEYWSEGSGQNYTVVSSLPAGKYTMRLEVLKETGTGFRQPGRLGIVVEQGVPRWGQMFLFMFLVSILPAGVGVYHWLFERRRWSESDFGGE